MRKHWFWVAAFALCGAITIDAASAQTQKRLALVIGNSSYTNFAPVKTAEKDAADIGAVLNLAGFQVVLAQNLPGSAMKQVIQEFGDLAKDADLVAFYFGGQAIQTGGANYLMPVDASKASRQQAIDTATSLDAVIDRVPKKAAMVVLLDAPRTDPFEKPGDKSKGEFVDASGPRFIHIAFATAPGSPLAPFSGANSAFATAILKHIKTPALPLEELDKAVRRETANLTGGKQIPWSSTSGRENIFFFLPAR
jgi:uncharacterized caspase-like protein